VAGLNYFSVLDTVRFGPEVERSELATRSVSSTGVLLLELLVGGGTVLLSQTQAFDNAMLLEYLAANDAESLALRRLVQSGRIQVRIFDSPALRELPSGGQRFTLLNAFCSAMSQRDFVLSAWPELGDHGRRLAIVECLDRAPNRLRALCDDDVLAGRIEAVRELDLSLRKSPASERAMPVVGKNLYERVSDDLETLPADEPTEAAMYWLAGRLAVVDPGRLRGRSTWYRLLDELAAQHPIFSGPEENLRAIVDGAYNRVVADSLGATGTFTQYPAGEVAAAIAEQAGIDATTDRQLVLLAEDQRRDAWLTWSEAASMIDDLTELPSPWRRLDHLVRRHQEYVGVTETSTRGQMWLAIAATIPPLIGSVAGATAEELVGALPGALGGGALGGLVSISGLLLPSVFPLGKHRWRERHERISGERWETTVPTVTTGSASWRRGLGEAEDG